MLQNKLLVNEIFDSFQGEGFMQGTVCTFVRLQGCSVGCSYCDTKNTWTTSSKFMQAKNIILMKNSNQDSFYSGFTIEEIADSCKENYVVVTGGEPFEQDISELLKYLTDNGKSVQVETSGNSKIGEKVKGVWYTVSPKITKKTDIKILQESITKADELKIVPTPEIVVNLGDLLKYKAGSCILSFQPESCKEDSKELCIELAKKYKGRISIQSHKYTKDR